MKIHCLAENVFLCKIRQLKILLNCPLEIKSFGTHSTPPTPLKDLSSVLNHYFSDQGKRALETRMETEQCTLFRIPDLGLIDLATVDLVLISHTESMLGLPYLTEYLGYKGKIIATEPTIEFAKQRMEELLVYHGPHVSSIAPGVSYQPTVAIEDQWRKIYTAKDIQRCIEKIQSVRYNETLFLFSTLSLVAYSSGHSLGSANWVIETSFKKIVFLSTTSLYPNLHPAPFDPSVLLSADAVIASNVLEPSSNHVSFERSRGRCMAHIARAIQANQNVLIASPSTNLLFDLIGDIEGYFKTIGIRELGPAKDQIPIYVAYPIAHPSLQYANICGEWMNRDRQSMLYEPETPLAHGHLMRQGALHTIPHIDSHTLAAQPLREPCIVFAGEARAMQSGALPWFFQHWKNTKTTCLSILPETDWPLETLPEKTEINFVRIPLETRLRLEDLPSVLRHTELGENTRHLLIPLMKGADLVREDLSSQPHTSVYIYKVGDIINIDLERDWEKVTVSEKLAKTIQPISQRDTEGRVSMYAPIRGTLHFYNNNYELEPNTTPEQGQPQIRVELNTIVQRFEQHSIPIQVSQDDQDTIVLSLPVDMQGKVLLKQDAVIIVSDSQETRTLLRHLLVN